MIYAQYMNGENESVPAGIMAERDASQLRSQPASDVNMLERIYTLGACWFVMKISTIKQYWTRLDDRSDLFFSAESLELAFL